MKDVMLSIGGSTIHPDTGINIEFLKSFNKFVRKKIAQDKNLRFFLVVGGGHAGREYQYVARDVIGRKLDDESLDWLGIEGTRLNANLVRIIFKDIAEPKIIEDYDENHKIGKKQVVVCGGWRPGWSTDYNMVLLAKEFKAKRVICLCNVKFVYNKNPNLFPKAKPIPKMTWDEYLEMIGDWWEPTRQLPFDPFAAKLAKKTGLKMIILKGTDLANFEKAFEGKKFVGTTIH